VKIELSGVFEWNGDCGECGLYGDEGFDRLRAIGIACKVISGNQLRCSWRMLSSPAASVNHVRVWCCVVLCAAASVNHVRVW